MTRALLFSLVLTFGGVHLNQIGRTAPAIAPTLPEVETAHYLPAIRHQVEQAVLAARTNPMDAVLVGKLGMVLDAYEQFGAAEVCYRRASLLDPTSSQWMYNLATVEFQQGEYEQAAQDFARALQLDPRRLPAAIHLGDSLLASGKWEESAKRYEEALRQAPDSASALCGLGRALAARGENARAAEMLVRACEVFPHYGAAHYALAAIYRKLEENQKAEEQIGLYEADRFSVPPLEDPARAQVAALDMSPNSCLRRAAEMERAGDIEGAIREHERALEIDSDEVQAHINLVILYGRLGDVQKAEEHFKAAVALNRNRADAYYNYGVLMVGARRYLEAEQAFRHATELNPYHAEAYHNLGSLLERQRRLADAAAEYRLALAARPDYRLARYHLARILVNQGKLDDAIQQLLKSLIPEDDGTPTYLFALGAAYARAGDRGNARIYLRKARQMATLRGQAQLLPGIDQALRELGR